MAEKNRKAYEDVVAALNRLYFDIQVPRETTRRDLQALRDEIDVLLDALGKGIRRS